jgi:HPt (histidine-containing phosphotransfer) domain-containing protein
MSAAPIDPDAFAELQASAGTEFVAELVDTFLEEAPRMLEELRSAAAAGRADLFRRAAHSLKSNAHTFGATALGAMARELELGGLPADSADAALAALGEEYARVAGRLRELRDG